MQILDRRATIAITGFALLATPLSWFWCVIHSKTSDPCPLLMLTSTQHKQTNRDDKAPCHTANFKQDREDALTQRVTATFMAECPTSWPFVTIVAPRRFPSPSWPNSVTVIDTTGCPSCENATWSLKLSSYLFSLMGLPVASCRSGLRPPSKRQNGL